MKALSVLCAVSIIVGCVCVVHSVAVPFPASGVDLQVDLDEPVETEAPQEHEQFWTETSAVETNPEVLFRTKRQSHLSLCRYCCNCCKNKGCGFCCRF
ncbi:hepcidin-1 [Trichomycterus rosablanca]|uniref:hepcidin-1 n=1 Tax=Trichomycterus rosablanca TaxID=2290929 RepID=UPI002F35B3A4